jgi:uncharacterized membrane protein YkvA (DUF1232 family)
MHPSLLEDSPLMRVTFDLSEKDLRYFRSALQKARKSAKSYDESVIIDGARDLVKEVGALRPPDFIGERIAKLRELIDMLEDDEWRLTGQDRARVLNALAYFVDPDDLIPDKVPGIGYLDDAIMVELVLQELRHEIEAYDDFCEFRKTRPKRAAKDSLEGRRVQLQSRMRRRRRRDRGARAGSRPTPGKSPFSLW